MAVKIRQRSGKWWLGAAATALLLATPASAIVKCRTADGKLHFVDIPPPGCEVEGSYENARPPAEQDGAAGAGAAAVDQADVNAIDARALAQRRRIERTMNEAAEKLHDVREEIAGTPRVAGGVYRRTAGGIIDQARDQKVLDEIHTDLRARESALLEEIAARREEFRALTAEVEDAHGGTLPASWAREPRCRRCP